MKIVKNITGLYKYFFLLGLAFGPLCLNAQNDFDTDYYESLIKKSELAIGQLKPDSAIPYLEEALELAENGNEQKMAAVCLHLLAKVYEQKNNVPIALRYYLHSLKTRENINHNANLVDLHFEIAALYERWGVFTKSFEHFNEALSNPEFVTDSITIVATKGMARNKFANGELDEALAFYNKLLKIYESQNDKKGEAETLRNTIKVYKEKEDIKNALASSYRVLQMNESQKDTAEIIVTLNNIGFLNKHLNDLPQALNNFTKAAEMEDQFKPKSGSNPITLSNIGILYQNLGDYDNSLKYLFRAIDKLKGQNVVDMAMLANLNNLIAIIYLNQNDFNSAYSRNQMAIDLAKGISDKEIEQLAYKTRSEIYKQIKDYEESLEHFRVHAKLKDSLLIAKQMEREEKLQKQFSAEQTEKEMSLLIVDREIEELKLKQDLLENERLRQETALKESLLEQERLEKEQAEQALLLAQQDLEKEKTEQELFQAQQLLDAEQKDRQIALLEKEQSDQALLLAEQRLQSEQQDREIAQAAQKQAELNLALQEKDFELKNQKEALFRNFVFGVLILALIILGLLYRVALIRRRANKKLGAQKKELERLIGDLKNTQIQLVQSEKMASLGQLTAGVAHEINNPLNFVTTNSHALKLDLQEINLLLDEVHELKNNPSKVQIQNILNKIDELDTEFLSDEIKQLIDSIERGALRTKNIVTSLRIFSRNVNDEFVKADIHEGLDSTLTILSSKLKDNITVHKSYGKIPLITCQFDKLNQVFMNIINNAIQAIEGSGDIFIKTEKLNGEVQISIQDNGKGMTAETQKRIFEPFFTTKEIGEGTGLGLSISYGIIEKHNGRIEVSSEIGKGTNIVVYLPIEIIDNSEAHRLMEFT